MPTCARVTSLGIYLYVALDLPVRPGLSDPGPFYDHYHYGPPGPLMQPFPRGRVTVQAGINAELVEQRRRGTRRWTRRRRVEVLLL